MCFLVPAPFEASLRMSRTGCTVRLPLLQPHAWPSSRAAGWSPHPPSPHPSAYSGCLLWLPWCSSLSLARLRCCCCCCCCFPFEFPCLPFPRSSSRPSPSEPSSSSSKMTMMRKMTHLPHHHSGYPGSLAPSLDHRPPHDDPAAASLRFRGTSPSARPFIPSCFLRGRASWWVAEKNPLLSSPEAGFRANP